MCGCSKHGDIEVGVSSSKFFAQSLESSTIQEQSSENLLEPGILYNSETVLGRQRFKKDGSILILDELPELDTALAFSL